MAAVRDWTPLHIKGFGGLLIRLNLHNFSNSLNKEKKTCLMLSRDVLEFEYI